MIARCRSLAIAALIALSPLCAAPTLAGEHGGGHESGGHGGEGQPELPYIKLNDINVTIFGDQRVRGMLTVAMSLEVTEPDKHAKVTADQPLLRDAYFRRLTRYAGSRSDLRRPINVTQLGAMLQQTTDKVLGGHFAKVLISAAAIRRM